jgi:Asp-tRNA(Asn)/Glu-tRNA(Gln) amidotransferase A subunit family amidase
MPQALHEQSASTLVPQLERREITAEQLVRACLDRIQAREGDVQAWEYLAADNALEQARQLDRRPVQGLLHGIPIAVKDLFDTADMPTTYGSPIYASHQPVADAAAVALCRAQGALMLGKTVTTEFATFKPGKTRNPHGVTHTPGGSSSGSAAAVADCMVPLAFASQTAASVIRPAAFCGVVGYKPSFGLVNRTGVKGLSDTLDTIGFIARSVDDVALFAAATTGDRGLLQLDVSHAPRIALCHTHEWPHADEDTHKAFEHAARVLALAGMPIRELQLPLLFSQLLQAQKEIMAFDVVRSLAHERLRQPHLLSDQLNQVINIGLEIPVERHYANLQLAQSARGMVSNAFGAFEVLLAPSAIGEAPDTLSQTGDPVFSRVWTLLGLPCVHVPFLKGHSGMPVGLQVVGRHGEDKVVLRVAKWLMERMAPA